MKYITILLIFLCLCFSHDVIHADISEGLVAYYPFNGNANDESGNEYDGIVHGAEITTDRFDINNSAYYFDGNSDYIDLGDSFDNYNKISICTWIYVNDNALNKNYLGIIEKHSDYENKNKTFSLVIKNKYILARFYQSDTGLENTATCYYDDYTVENKWYFITAIFDDGIAKLYIDGKMVDTESTNISLQNTNTHTLVGNHASNTHSFYGKIDDIRIYNRALSDGEIQELYSKSEFIAQSPKSGPPGTSFTQWGTGFTPDGIATLHFQKPDGTENLTQTISLDSQGHFEIEYTAPHDKPTGKYAWWAVDDSTGIQSNKINYEITGGGQSASLEGKVYDQSTGSPINDALISLGDQNTNSGESGEYSLSSLAAGDYNLEVSKSGYASYTKSVYLPADSSSTKTIWLSSQAGGSDIQVTGLSSRFPGETVFLQGVDLEVEYTANVDWNGHPPEKVVFHTSHNTYEVATSGSTASMTINIGDEFDSCDVLTVKAVSSDGYTSQLANGPMSVADKPYPVDFPIRYDIGDGFGFKTSVGPNLSFIDNGVEKGIIPESIPLFGDKKFKLEWIPEVSFEYDSNGMTEIKAQSRGAKFDLAGFDVELSGALGGEAQFLRQECAWDWDGNIGVEGKVSAKKSWPFVVTAGPVPIPMYLKASIKAEADAELSLLAIDPVESNGVIGIAPYVRGSLGAGADSKLAVEGWLGGGADFGLQWPNTPTLEKLIIYLNGGVTVYALLWDWETEALRWDWNCYDQDASYLYAPDVQQIMSQKPQLAPRGYLKESGYGTFMGSRPAEARQTANMAASPEFSSLQPLQTTIFPRSESFLSAANDHVALAWLYDHPERTAENRTLAVISFWDGSAWSEPVGIEDDGTADFHPQLLTLADGMVLAAWENEKTELSQGATFEDMVQNLEISAAVFDPDQGTWQTAVDLTDNEYIDSAPRLSGQAGNTVLTWVGNAANDLRGNSTTPNTLYWSEWNGTSWSAGQEAASIPYGLINYDLSSKGTSATAVFSLDTDDNATSISDQELFSLTYTGGTWGSLTQITDNNVPDTRPQLARDPDGNLILVWYQDGDVLSMSGLDLNTRQVITSGEYSTNQADFELASSVEGHMAVTWAEASEFSSDIYAVYYDPIFGVWGQPKQLTDDAETEQYLTSAFSNPEQLMVVYDRTEVNVQTMTRETASGHIVSYEAPNPVTTDLYMASYGLHGDLAATGISFQPGNPAPGSDLRVTVPVSNQGDTAAADLPVAFYHGDPAESGVQIGQATLAGTLRPGDSQEASLTWTVPQTSSSLDIFAVVDPEATFDDADRTNNQVNGTILAPDLGFATTAWNHIAGTTYEVSARVKNTGVLASDSSSLVFRKGEQDGKVVGSHSLPAIDSLASKEVTQAVDMSALSMPIYALIDTEGAVNEYDEANNDQVILLVAQDSDDDGLSDGLEKTTCTESDDADSDEDGIKDGEEDTNSNGQVDPGETDPCDIDTDKDGIQDGTEKGLTESDVGNDTNLAYFQADLDPTTTTDPLDDDTDSDGILDGDEDANHNGRIDPGETDPNDNPDKALPWLMLLLGD